MVLWHHGTMPFYTEKQIEDWLESETREVTLPNGTTRAVSVIRLAWSKADSLVSLDGYTMRELAGYAAEEEALQRISLNQAFVCVVAYLDNRRRARWGI